MGKELNEQNQNEAVNIHNQDKEISELSNQGYHTVFQTADIFARIIMLLDNVSAAFLSRVSQYFYLAVATYSPVWEEFLKKESPYKYKMLEQKYALELKNNDKEKQQEFDTKEENSKNNGEEKLQAENLTQQNQEKNYYFYEAYNQYRKPLFLLSEMPEKDKAIFTAAHDGDIKALAEKLDIKLHCGFINELILADERCQLSCNKDGHSILQYLLLAAPDIFVESYQQKNQELKKRESKNQEENKDNFFMEDIGNAISLHIPIKYIAKDSLLWLRENVKNLGDSRAEVNLYKLNKLAIEYRNSIFISYFLEEVKEECGKDEVLIQLARVVEVIRDNFYVYGTINVMERGVLRRDMLFQGILSQITLDSNEYYEWLLEKVSPSKKEENRYRYWCFIYCASIFSLIKSEDVRSAETLIENFLKIDKEDIEDSTYNELLGIDIRDYRKIAIKAVEIGREDLAKQIIMKYEFDFKDCIIETDDSEKVAVFKLRNGAAGIYRSNLLEKNIFRDGKIRFSSLIYGLAASARIFLEISMRIINENLKQFFESKVNFLSKSYVFAIGTFIILTAAFMIITNLGGNFTGNFGFIFFGLLSSIIFMPFLKLASDLYCSHNHWQQQKQQNSILNLLWMPFVRLKDTILFFISRFYIDNIDALESGNNEKYSKNILKSAEAITIATLLLTFTAATIAAFLDPSHFVTSAAGITLLTLMPAISVGLSMLIARIAMIFLGRQGFKRSYNKVANAPCLLDEDVVKDAKEYKYPEVYHLFTKEERDVELRELKSIPQRMCEDVINLPSNLLHLAKNSVGINPASRRDFNADSGAASKRGSKEPLLKNNSSKYPAKQNALDC